MMDPDTARKLALSYCMQGCGRYLECLHGVVVHLAEHLPDAFVAEVRHDYNVYVEKMTAAGMPVKVVNVGEQSG